MATDDRITPTTFVKDPAAVLDYLIDWADWLDGDSIISSEWVPGGGLTVSSSSHTSTTATVWVAGGTIGKAGVTNHITTLGGRQNDWTLKFKVVET